MPYSVTALAGKTILIAEDDYLLADTIEAAIRSAGAEVQGPFPTVRAALGALASTAADPNGAVLNIRLADADSYPIADELIVRGIPVVFASANSATSLPTRFSKVPLISKPYAAYQVVQALAALLNMDEARAPS